MRRAFCASVALLVLLWAVGVQAAWVPQQVPDPIPNQGGDATADNAEETAWTVSGSGVDIWGTSDEFMFVYWDEPKSEDFALSCHVISLGGTPSTWGKAGLMARMAPTATASPPFQGPESYAFCAATTNNGTVLQWRDGEGAGAAWDGAAVNQWLVGPNDVYLKLVREGSTFRGYASLDGEVWISLGSHTFASILEGDELYVGLAVTAHDQNALATAKFDQVNLEDPGISEAAPENFACSLDADQTTVLLSWDIPAGVSYNELKLYRAPAGGTPSFVKSIGGGDSSTSDSPGEGMWTYYLVGDDNGIPTVAVSCQIRVGGAGIITADGFIASWLMLGPLDRSGGAAPPPADRLEDYLTDGVSITEANVLPYDGLEIEIDFTVAQSTGVQGPMANGQNPDAVDGVAVWYQWDAPSDTINHDTFYGQNPDQHMVYSVCYLDNPSNEPLFMICGIASDDTIVVMLDNTVFFNGGASRGYGGAGVIQDRFPFVLPPGQHRLMVKVFDGGVGSGFRLRFENIETGEPITDKFTVRIAPTMTSVPAAPTATVTRTLKTLIVGQKSTVSLTVTGGPVDVIEHVPANLTVGSISNGGTLDNATNTITWKNVPDGTVLTYEVTPTGKDGLFIGFAQESPPDGLWLAVGRMSVPLFAESIEGWFTADIADSGLPNTSAEITRNPGPPETYDMTIVGSGHDIWDAADDFRFVWREFSADESVVVECRLVEFNRATNDWAKAGVMFRTLAAQESPDVYLAIRPHSGNPGDHDVAWQWRDTFGANAAWGGFGDTVENVMLPYWLRCVYQDGVVTGYYAPDMGGEPGDWIQAGQPHPLNLEGSDTYLAGICVTSHDDNALVTAVFDNVRITGLCEPVRVERSFDLTGLEVVDYEGTQAPIYADGTDIAVTLTLSDVRPPDSPCGDLGDVTITEYLPEGFTAKDISGGGQLQGSTIVWTIPAAQLSEGTLTYVASGTITGDSATFSGEVDEVGGSEFAPFSITGQNTLLPLNGLGRDPGTEGVIKSWLILGPLSTGPTAINTNAAAIQQDFLTDGTVTEEEVRPRAGDEIAPDFNGASPATGIAASPNPALNPHRDEGKVQWYAWRDADGAYVDLDTNSFFAGVDLAMAYGVCYLDVEEPMFVTFMVGSDDAIEVKLDGEQIWVNPANRPWPGFQDATAQVMLSEGVHVLMVKVFENGGGWNFGVQITDEFGAPVTEGICVSLNPEGCVSGGGPQVNVYLGEVNGDGAVNIADAIALLGYLFGGQAEPGCMKAADANDDGGVNIADAITMLGYLFGGQPMIAPDGTPITAANHPGCAPYSPDDVADVGCKVQCK